MNLTPTQRKMQAAMAALDQHIDAAYRRDRDNTGATSMRDLDIDRQNAIADAAERALQIKLPYRLAWAMETADAAIRARGITPESPEWNDAISAEWNARIDSFPNEPE